MRTAALSAFSTFLAFGDESRAVPLPTFRVKTDFSFNLGGNTELFVPFIWTDNSFLFIKLYKGE